MPDTTPSTLKPDDRTGSVIGHRYRLQRRIGVGGMGEVYEAKHTEIPRRFAVKMLRAEYARDPEMQARFRQEAQAAAGLSSDHIVEVADFGCAEDGSPYLVMELLEGIDLRRLLAKLGKLPVDQAVAVARQACAGGGAAHAAGIIHRDLKPENLFIAMRGGRTMLKVLDFGIAKLRSQSLDTGAGRLLGTVSYMPPEQIRCESDIDLRADVYAVGAILYEALTGTLPHPGEAQHEIVSHILFERPTPVCALNPDIPAELEAIVDRALATAARERHQSMDELAEALAPFAGTGVLPAPIGSDDAGMTPTLPALESEPRVPSPSPDAGAAPHRRTVRSVMILTAGALLVLVALWIFASDAPTSNEARVTAVPTVARAAPAREPEPAPAREPALLSSAPAVAPAPEATQAVALPSPLDTPRRRERPRAKLKPSLATPEPAPTTAASVPSDVIEVRRGERTIVFKRENPLQQ